MHALKSPLLVATDFSPASVEALAYAVRLGDAVGAEVRLLHVLAESGAIRFGAEEKARAQTQDAAQVTHAQEALRQLAASISVALPCVVRRGRAPAEVIVAEAADIGAGLVVLGTCGQRPSRAGMGAVSGEVIQTAPCDVLLVPHREEGPYSKTPVQRILVPVDFSGASTSLVSLGRRLADSLDAHVDLVHVLEPLPHPVRWLDETLVDLIPQIQERAEAALRTLAEDASSHPRELGLYVERGKAAPTIPQVAEALGTDLVVLGPHAERPVFDRLLGSVAEGVARRVSCPVLIARASAEPEDVAPSIDTHSYEAVV
ncbi:MAG: universal stress protein [Rubricoccaceae bacterium]